MSISGVIEPRSVERVGDGAPGEPSPARRCAVVGAQPQTELQPEAGAQLQLQTQPQPQPQPQVVMIAVAALSRGDSPRSAGEDFDHVRLLAASGAQLPPIMVHRETMTVVDGMHRLRAARERGATHIRAVFCDGDKESVFIEAVRANIRHGLPLSLADRRAAAARVLRVRPELSDRAVAEIVGLSPKTVGSVRRGERGEEESAAVVRRVGRDGRARAVRTSGNVGGEPESRGDAGVVDVAVAAARWPEVCTSGYAVGEPELLGNAGVVDLAVTAARWPESAAARGDGALIERVTELLQDGGRAIGEIFRESRERQAPGEGAQPDAGGTAHTGRYLGAARSSQGASGRRTARQPLSTAAAEALVRALVRDPSLRCSESGRQLLRRLIAAQTRPEEWVELMATAPVHCREALGRLAVTYARAWEQIALNALSDA